MFLQTILQESETSLMHRFFQAQLRKPTKGDWCQGVLKSIRDLDLNLTFSQVKVMKKEDLQNVIKHACKEVHYNI